MYKTSVCLIPHCADNFRTESGFLALPSQRQVSPDPVDDLFQSFLFTFPHIGMQTHAPSLPPSLLEPECLATENAPNFSVAMNSGWLVRSVKHLVIRSDRSASNCPWKAEGQILSFLSRTHNRIRSPRMATSDPQNRAGKGSWQNRSVTWEKMDRHGTVQQYAFQWKVDFTTKVNI